MAPAYEDLQIFADSPDMVWDMENENDQADDDLLDNQLEMLQRLTCKKQPSAAVWNPAGNWAERADSPKTRRTFTLSNNLRE